MRFLLPGLTACASLVSLGCSSAPAPSATPVVATVAALPDAAVAPVAVASSTPTDPDADAAKQAEVVAPVEVDKGPVLDCSKFPKGKAPNRRSLCEMVMSDRPEAGALDARGFVAVEYFDRPGEGDEAGRTQSKDRLCGAKAEGHFAKIARNVRYSLSASLDDAERIKCKGLVCMFSGRSEYDTFDTLRFRKGPAGLVVDEWTSVEVILVSEPEVQVRYKWIESGVAEASRKRCP